MLKETALSIIYLKGLLLSTYGPWIYISYKYEPLTKIFNTTIGQNIVSSIENKHPYILKFTRWLYYSSEAFAEKCVHLIKSNSYIEKNKYIGNFAKQVCPKKLSRSFIHASITCKLLFPAYCGVAYKLASKSFETNKNKYVK
jgi:hypothetical protein